MADKNYKYAKWSYWAQEEFVILLIALEFAKKHKHDKEKPLEWESLGASLPRVDRMSNHLLVECFPCRFACVDIFLFTAHAAIK